MIRKIPQHVKNVLRVPLPSLLLDHHKIDELGVYFMFVNGHIFLVSTSIINIQGGGSTEAENGLKTTISAFTARKMNIEMIVGYNKFEAVHKSLRPVHVE